MHRQAARTSDPRVVKPDATKPSAAPAEGERAGAASPGAVSVSAAVKGPDGWRSWAAAAAASGDSLCEPRVLYGVHGGMRVVADETFGPLLCVQVGGMGVRPEFQWGAVTNEAGGVGAQ